MKQSVVSRNRFLIMLGCFLLVGLTTLGGSHSAPPPPPPAQLTPDGQFAFVSNNGSSDVSIYTVNSNGSLQPAGSVPAGSGPQGIAVGPAMQPSPYAISGQPVYVVNENNNTVGIYTVNPSSGQLTPVGTVDTGGNPQAVAIDSSGHMAIVANMGSNTATVYAVSPTNGNLTPMQTVPTGQNPMAVTINDMNGQVYVANSGSNNISVYSMDMSSGTVNPVGTVNMPPGAGAPSSIDVLPSGNVAVATSPSTNNMGVFLVPQNPAVPLIPLAAVPTGNGPTSIDIGPNGVAAVTLTGASGKQGAGLVALFQISPTGTVTPRGIALTQGSGPAGVAFDPKGFFHVTNSRSNTISSFALLPGSGAMFLGTRPTGQSPKGVALALRRN